MMLLLRRQERRVSKAGSSRSALTCRSRDFTLAGTSKYGRMAGEYSPPFRGLRHTVMPPRETETLSSVLRRAGAEKSLFGIAAVPFARNAANIRARVIN